MAIPVIDFSKLDGDDEMRMKTLAEIASCCEEWGFFQIINHGISEELLDRVKKVASECYRLEREPAFNLIKTKETNQNMDWEDVFFLSDENGDQWPSKTPCFKEIMNEYRGELKKLAIRVMEIMDENLGLPKGYIKNAFNGNNEAFFGTKVSHYPPCPHPEKVNGLRAHTDAGGVILLFQDDEVKGLQMLKDDTWIDVQPVKNAIVINTGDQIEVVSNGRYKSAWHRVVARADGNRRSIASFYNPSLKATIGPAAQLVNDSAKYPEFVFGDYMSVYVQQKFMPKEPRFEAMRAL